MDAREKARNSRPNLPKLRSLGTTCYLCDRPALFRDHEHGSGLCRGDLCAKHNTLAQHPDDLRLVLAYVEASPIGEPYSEYKLRKGREYYQEFGDALRKQQRQRDYRDHGEPSCRGCGAPTRGTGVKYCRKPCLPKKHVNG